MCVYASCSEIHIRRNFVTKRNRNQMEWKMEEFLCQWYLHNTTLITSKCWSNYQYSVLPSARDRHKGLAAHTHEQILLSCCYVNGSREDGCVCVCDNEKRKRIPCEWMIITKSNCNSQWWWRQRQLCYCSCRIPHPYRSQFRCSAIKICHWFDIIEFRLLATSRSSFCQTIGKWASERHIACYCSSYENIFVRAPRFPFSRGIERTTTKYFLFLRIRNEVQRAKFFAFSCWIFYVRFLRIY